MNQAAHRDTFTAPPDPGQCRTLDELVGRLRLLKIWAGNPSFETIKNRVNAAWQTAGRPAAELTKKGTVVDCFKVGRRRLNVDLVAAVVKALHPDAGYVTQWRQALYVISGEMQAGAQVRAQDMLPNDLPEFVGRDVEVERIRHLVNAHDASLAVASIEGLAGIGKTRLATHVGHLLAGEKPFDHVLFVDLRGVHPDPAQPPVEPVAVLDSFLRLLGVPAHRIPHGLPARTAAYRRWLADRRILVVLDNAVNEQQVEPLLPDSPGSVALITSRHSLGRLRVAIRITLDVFTPDEATAFLARLVPDISANEDSDALGRIANRCGHLPLALALLASLMRATPSWSVSDHAERLEQRHQDRRLEAGVERALALSCQHLPALRQRLFRLLALHPGLDFDTYAAAALADIDLDTAGEQLRLLDSDHLLQQGRPGRFAFHELVRVYGMERAADEDRPAERREALTRLFDYYLATAAAAMDIVQPAEAHRRPRIPPCVTPAPVFVSPDTARAWLAAELPCLVSVACHAADHGLPSHTIRLSAILLTYLVSGHYGDAIAIHSHALDVGRRIGDREGQAQGLLGLGGVHYRLGRYEVAAECLQQALTLFRRLGNPLGEARALDGLGDVERRTGHYRMAVHHHMLALSLYRRVGDPMGEADALTGLGTVEHRLNEAERGADHLQQAVALFRRLADPHGEATALNNLGLVEQRLQRYQAAADHLRRALTLFRRLGNPRGEGSALDSLGIVYTRLGRPSQAAEHHLQALTLFREIGARDSEAWALNGLGEAVHAAGDAAEATSHHTAAHAIATEIGARDQHARAHAGLARAHQTLGHRDRALQHCIRALALHPEPNSHEAGELRTRLAALRSYTE
ncbi:tetratricopeptide repeat protein [Micromonospora sp. NPDC048930]|uniref:tetratricopeptide repeat protein n=1 Tax=Micromonospora sp. NPDC048930 TaxID=3364261 RepID=UPI003723C55C